MVAFKPFKSAIEALEQVNAVAEGVATTELLDFLEANLPKVGLNGVLGPSKVIWLICNTPFLAEARSSAVLQQISVTLCQYGKVNSCSTLRELHSLSPLS